MLLSRPREPLLCLVLDAKPPETSYDSGTIKVRV